MLQGDQAQESSGSKGGGPRVSAWCCLTHSHVQQDAIGEPAVLRSVPATRRAKQWAAGVREDQKAAAVQHSARHAVVRGCPLYGWQHT